MNIETGKIPVPLWLILVIALIIFTAVFGGWYYITDESNVKTLGILGGITTGLVVYIATFVTLLRPIQDADRFHKMGIKALLENRHDKNYYRDLVGKSSYRVDVMGATCTRFVEDFLDVDSEDKVLVDALSKHNRLKVRLLIPIDEILSVDARASVQGMLAKLALLDARFGDKVELRRFPDKAHHSFILVDNDLVAGPIFEVDKSKYAPAVHVTTNTVFGQKYNTYFDSVWNACCVRE